jgi:Putative lumazine-binding
LRAILASALALLVLCAGCGKSSPSEESRVRVALERLARATAAHDYRTLCDDVLAENLVKQMESAGVPCTDALRAGLGSVRRPRLRVVRVSVRGKRATATVHTSATGQKASDDTVALVKADGQWRVASLADSGGR